VAGTTAVTTQSCTLPTPNSAVLATNTTYYVTVSAHSSVATTVTGTPRPSGRTGAAPAPTVSAVSTTTRTITFGSTSSDYYPATFTGYVFTASGDTNPANAVATCSRVMNAAGSVTCVFPAGLPGGTYYARARGTNIVGTGAMSSARTFTLPAAAAPLAAAVTPAAGPTGALLTTWATAPLSTGTTRWLTRVYASKTSTTVLGSCIAAAKTRTCTVSGLVHGRTYYASVWRLNSLAPSLRLINHTSGRAR